jgi:hypothetical protein
MRVMKKRLAVLTITALASVGAAAPAAHAVELEGTVTQVNKTAKTFNLNDGKARKIYVLSTTKFRGLKSFNSIRVGSNSIKAEARRRNGRWVAMTVFREDKT